MTSALNTSSVTPSMTIASAEKAQRPSIAKTLWKAKTLHACLTVPPFYITYKFSGRQ